MSTRVSAFPYLFKEGKMYVVLVTNKKGNQWIFPKGHTEKKFHHGQVALIEAYEEAGICGFLEPKSLAQKFTYSTTKKNHIVHCFPVLVNELIEHWEEAGHRERSVVTLEIAKARLKKPVYLEMIAFYESHLALKA